MHTAHDTNIATAGDGEGSSDCFCTSIISSLCMYLVGHSGKEHELEIGKVSI